MYTVFLIVIACGTGCAQCLVSSDGTTTTCTTCKAYYALKDGTCNGKPFPLNIRKSVAIKLLKKNPFRLFNIAYLLILN